MADPVSQFLGFELFKGFTVGKLAGIVGLNILTSRLLQPKLPDGSRGLSAIQTTVRDPLAYRSVVYGEAAVSGPIVYANVAGDEREDLWWVIALADHQCEDLIGIYLDDRYIPKADIAWTAGTGASDGTGTAAVSTSAFVGDDSTTALFARYYLGDDAQPVCGALDTAFADIDTNFRLRGVTYLVLQMRYVKETEKVWQSGAPGRVRVVLRGRRVYDPRLDSTRVIDPTTSPVTMGSGAHRANDETTWAWSDTPPLCKAHYMMDYVDADPEADIDWPAIADAADDCETLVTIPPAGSPATTQKRFTCNGALSLGSTHKDNVDAILSSYAGRMTWANGLYTGRASVWPSGGSSFSITEDHIKDNISVQGSASPENRFNTVVGYFVDPDRDHQPVEFPHVSRAAYVTRDNSETITFELELPMTSDQYMAQRIAYRVLDQADNQIAVRITMDHRGAQIQSGDVVDLTVDDLSWSAKTFRAVEWEARDVEEGGGDARTVHRVHDLTLQEDDSGSYTDPSVSDYTGVTQDDITVPADVVAAPSMLAAKSVAYGIEWTWVLPPEGTYDRVFLYTADASASPEIQFANADLIYEGRATKFVEQLADGDTRRGWVRARKNNTFSARDPDSDTSTIVGTATAGPVPVQLSTVFLEDVETGGGDAEVALRIDSDGDQYESEGDGAAFTSVITWLLSGLNTDYEVRLSNISGTSPTGAAVGSWLATNADRTWTWTRSTNGITTFTGTLEIRDDTTLEVLASVSVTINIERTV